MVSRFVILLLGLLQGLSAAAQALDTGLFFGDLPVQEKVYVHFDNNTYFQGDTIWYKAYVVTANDNRPRPLSRVLYVELYDEQGYLKERQQLVVDEQGQARGQFAIAHDAFAGFYEVRAYTKWMLNFGYGRMLKVGKTWYVKDMHGFHKFFLSTTPDTKSRIVNFGGQMAGDLQRQLQFLFWKDDDAKMKGNKTEENRKMRKAEAIPTTVDIGDAYYAVIDGIEMDEVKWANMLAGIDSDLGDYYDNGVAIDPDQLRKDYRTYNNLFSRVIPVYSRPDSAENYLRRIMPTKITMGDYERYWQTPEFDIKFYPEGGAMIEGVEGRVGWEALDQELSRINVGCTLIEDGTPIDSVHAIHAGRGRFALLPKHGKKYELAYTAGDKTLKFELPEAKEEGVGMKVDMDERGVYIDISPRFKTPRQLYLSITSRGRLLQNFKLGKDSLETIAIDKTDLQEGVNQATVYDSVGIVYSDRLFFVNDFERLKGKIIVEGIADREYTPNEKINLSLLATDGLGRALKEETFSVAVRDAAQLTYSFATGNIMTNLLLESEIKGFIETPDYYFEADDEIHRKALDLLMMVQGWRRYDWQEVARPNTFILDFMPEDKMRINGDIVSLRKNLNGKEKGPVDVFCSLRLLADSIPEGQSWLYQGHVTTDSLNCFHIAYEPFYGNAKLILRGKYANKLGNSKYSRLQHDPKIFIRKEYFYPRNLKMYSWYETHTPDIVPDKHKITWQDIQQDIYASEWIPQVTIKKKKRAHAKRQKDKPVFGMKYIDYLNNVWDRGYYDPVLQLDYQMDSFGVMPTDSRLHYVVSPRFNEVWSRYYNWDQSGASSLNADYIPVLDSIYVVTDDPRRPVPYELRHLDREVASFVAGTSDGISGYINLTTVPNEKARRIAGREYTLQGFNRPAEFYNPDYSKAALPKVKDYRRTLYWNPDVTTDKNGQATISFYNNSVCKELDVSAEGISRQGEFLIKEENNE